MAVMAAGILFIVCFYAVAMVELSWVFGLLTTCELAGCKQMSVHACRTIACLVFCARSGFQLFLGKGYIPFLKNQVLAVVESKSQRQIRVCLALMMSFANVLSPVFLSSLCWRMLGHVPIFAVIVSMQSWIAVSLIVGQVYRSGLEFRIIKPAEKPKTICQAQVACIKYCRHFTARDVPLVVVTMVLSFLTGYIVLEICKWADIWP